MGRNLRSRLAMADTEGVNRALTIGIGLLLFVVAVVDSTLSLEGNQWAELKWFAIFLGLWLAAGGVLCVVVWICWRAWQWREGDRFFRFK